AGRALVRAAGLVPLIVPDPRSCTGALSAWVYGEPARALTTVGITGTNGKTTTAYLVEAILRAAGRRTGLIGTVETRIGDEAVASVRTTPEATDLQALLAVMRERGVEAVAMEVSSHALVLGRVDGVVYDVAVFTNLGVDHLDFHDGLEDYFAAKASLFTPARSRHGVVNVDDPYGARLATCTPVPVTTVSPSGRDADWVVTARTVDADAGTTFGLRSGEGSELALRSPLAGEFNVANAALAAVACLHLGIEPGAVERGLAGALGVPGRMERVVGTGRGEPLVLVDYAHTPDAVDTVLAALRPGVAGRLVVVLGAGGDRDRGKRPAMGAAAARHADLVVVTDDNPRSEDPAAIRAAVVSGACHADSRGVEVLEVPDRRTAIFAAVAATRPGDVVLVAGKGHERGQEVAGVVHPFDDREVAREALHARSAPGAPQ
ncbi:MAG: UDP-N-acetylmuramoyl-L-alanyl-D-glutamate--2,6-diaminopimelate ligase, partial [Actinomycetota bacterium]|nr:UDP-N-acetylmuramoyl-L-alanyl-D-glutamate--2,6-diaminopimelate ligase [Actinomycetota bacterium]